MSSRGFRPRRCELFVDDLLSPMQIDLSQAPACPTPRAATRVTASRPGRSARWLRRACRVSGSWLGGLKPQVTDVSRAARPEAGQIPDLGACLPSIESPCTTFIFLA